jgi:hypothetical protein
MVGTRLDRAACGVRIQKITCSLRNRDPVSYALLWCWHHPEIVPRRGTGGQSGVNNRMQAGGIRNDVRVWQSLRLRLPLLRALLMAVVLAALVTLAYREVRAPLLRTGSERAQTAADEIAGLFAHPSVEGAEGARALRLSDAVRSRHGTIRSYSLTTSRRFRTRRRVRPVVPLQHDGG